DVILGVRGKDHPLPAYLAAGVPVVLSTDDAGVARIDLTNEYFRAARDYGLSYRQLKAINALFLPRRGAKTRRARALRAQLSPARARRGGRPIYARARRRADQSSAHPPA